VSLWSVFACAQAPADASVADDDAALIRSLREQAGRAQTWRYAWTGVNGALAVGSFAPLPWASRESRPDWIVGGVGSVISTALTVFFPLRVENADADLAELERAPSAERHARLRALASRDADDERARFSLPWHALNLGGSVLVGSVLAFGFKRVPSGIATGVASFALGEAQLFTQPTALADSARSGVAFGLHVQEGRVELGFASRF